MILQCLGYVGVPKTLNAFSTVRKIGIIKEIKGDQPEEHFVVEGPIETEALMEGIKARYDRCAILCMGRNTEMVQLLYESVTVRNL